MNTYPTILAMFQEAIAPTTSDPSVLKVLELLGSASAKAASDLGFHTVQTDGTLDRRTRNLVWWASQALKKYRGCDASDTDELRKEAIANFLDRNNRCREVSLHWSYRDCVRECLAKALPEPTYCSMGRFGPGAVAEGLDALQRWSVFEDCDFCPRDPQIPGSGDLPVTGFLVPPCRTSNTGIDVARLVAVPKDNWRFRLITVEPARNSFLQQFVRSLIMESIHRGCLRGSPSDFLSYRDNVEIQQSRCVRASYDCSLATIDLKDASDCIPASDVFSLFPSWLIPWLDMSRTPYVSDGFSRHQLWMYGGMGNATTFLIETLYFWAVSCALGRDLRINARATVFGDDIILSTALARHPLFERMLEDRTPLILNRDKSCYRPEHLSLREACGMVAFDGQPLTRLIRLSAPGIGLSGNCHAADMANRLELSDIPAQRNLAEIIRESYPNILRASAHTAASPSLWRSERRWCAGSIEGCFFTEGDPPGPAQTDLTRYTRQQRWEVYGPVLSGKPKIARRTALSVLEALAVMSGSVQLRTHTHGKRTGRTDVLIPRPYHVGTSFRWIWVD